MAVDRHAVERLTQFHFDPTLRRMSTIEGTNEGIRIHCKGAPEELLPLCTWIATDGGARPLAQAERAAVESIVEGWADQGLRTLAIAERDLASREAAALPREKAERDLILLGLVAMFDPPRPEVPDSKLRIADALRDLGQVVAMTGDGVNDAPALRRADIGVAMGRSGTDVAREAATMILTDDNFASIVSAVQAGRRVYDNVRKFITYIFAHATPEVVPFLIHAASGANIALPLTVIQILAIDLGTETLPALALALGREHEEPGIMTRPPRQRGQNVIDGPMLARAWGLLGGVSAALVTTALFTTLLMGGWSYGADTRTGPLHLVGMQATTTSFLGIVACQIGTAVAARTQTASLDQIGLTSNRLLLWGIAFEITFTAAAVTLPPLQDIFGTRPTEPWQILALAPFPLIVWGTDELRRYSRRRKVQKHQSVPG